MIEGTHRNVPISVPGFGNCFAPTAMYVYTRTHRMSDIPFIIEIFISILVFGNNGLTGGFRRTIVQTF